MSTQRGKIYKFNSQKQVVSIYSHDAAGIPFENVSQLLIDSAHQLLAVTPHNTYIFDEKKKNFYPLLSDMIKKKPGSIFLVRDKSLVCFTGVNTTCKLTRHGKYFIPIPVAMKHFEDGRNAMFEDHLNRIYITDPGLSLNIFKTIEDSVPIRECNIHAETKCFYEQNDSILWIATTQGLMRLNENTFSYSMITVTDGLPNNFVYAVLPDKSGDLWLSTNNGLCKFNPRYFPSKIIQWPTVFNRQNSIPMPTSLPVTAKCILVASMASMHFTLKK